MGRMSRAQEVSAQINAAASKFGIEMRFIAVRGSSPSLTAVYKYCTSRGTRAVTEPRFSRPGSGQLPHAVESDSRERGPPVCFGVPEVHALDDASISGQINNTTGSARGNGTAHLNFAPRSISILNDDAQEIHGAAVDAQLNGAKCALLAGVYGVVVQATVDPAGAEKDHLRLLGCADLCTQNCCRNEQKQDRDDATAAILLHILISDSFATVQWRP